MRTREIDVEGKKWPICALSVDQVTQLIFTPEVTTKDSDSSETKASISGSTGFVKDRAALVVAASFNNLTMGDGEWFENGWDDPRKSVPAPSDGTVPAPWWTGRKIASKLDWTEVTTLYEEICRHTGLRGRVSRSEVPTAPGEEPAASAIH